MRHFGARGQKIIAWPLTIQRGGFAKITNESLTGIGVNADIFFHLGGLDLYPAQ